MAKQYKNKFQIFFATLILLFISSLAFSQKTVLEGEIIDQYGIPVKSAFIKKKGTRFATISNKSGLFRFSLSNADSVLVISKKGYYDREVHLLGEKKISVELIQIEESFFKAGGTQTAGGLGEWKEVNSSNSVSHFILENYHQSGKSVLDILEQMPGLTVNNSSGQPGSNVSVLSRGYESVISNQPLIIVDGVTINSGINIPDISPEISQLSTLNIKDVTQIEVLRDAASTAIFGSRGANGVIIIETKRGANTPFEVINHTQFGVSFSLPGDNSMDPLPYSGLINESLIAASMEPIGFPENPSAKNWQNEVTRTGIIANHTLAFQGGGSKSQFYLSGNIDHTTGVLNNSNLLTGGVRFNSSHTIAKWLSLRLNFNYSESQQESPVHTGNQFNSNPVIYALSYPPLSKGELQAIPELSIPFGQIDPVELFEGQETKNKASFLLGGADMKIKFSDNLSFHSKANGDYSFYTKHSLLLYPESFDRGGSYGLNSNRETSLYNWEFNNYLQYQKLSGKGNWLVLFGSNEIYLNTSDLMRADISGGTLPDGVLPIEAEGRNSRRISALYGKLYYAYDERFDLSVSFRREKILNQEGVDQYGLFPSFASGVWLKKMEIGRNSYFSGIKMFLGWGVPGANRFYAINYFKNNFNEQYYLDTSGAVLPKFDPNARWETTEEWNIGIETLWLSGSLNFKVTYFDRMRDNVAYLTAANQENILPAKWNYTGRVYNSGYELELHYQKSFEEIGVFGGFSMQINSSKVLTLGETNVGKIGYYPQHFNKGNPLTVFREGNAPGVFWGYINEGVEGAAILGEAETEVKSGLYEKGMPERGDYMFKDLDNNGIIDENDMTVIGNPAPAITYFINGGVIFDEFDITFVLDGTSGGDILNLTKTVTESTGGYNNRSVSMNGRWSETNPTGNLARVHFNDPNNNNRVHSGMVENGSFFRFNKIELGYNFSFKNEKKNRVYFSAHNFLTFSSYSSGMPVFSGVNNMRGVDFGTYPFSATLLVGLQLGI